MKLCHYQALLLLLLLLAVTHSCHAACTEYSHFVFVPNKDIWGHDMAPSPMAGELEDFFEDCERDDSCKAFNTWGYRKDKVVPLYDTSWGDCHGVYIKCRTWSELRTDVGANPHMGNQTHPAPYFLCPGTYDLASTVGLSGFVTIGCSDPVNGCIVKGPQSNFAFAGSAFGAVLSNLTLRDFATAVDALNAIVTIKKCNIIHNRLGLSCLSSLVVVEDSKFQQNKEYGAIDVSAGSLTISGSHFTSNEAEHGGALWCDSGASVCTVKDSVFEENRATKTDDSKGGAIYCTGGATCDIQLSSCSFSDNEADHGDSIFFESSSGCSFSLN